MTLLEVIYILQAIVENQQRIIVSEAELTAEQTSLKDVMAQGRWQEMTTEKFPLTVAAMGKPFWLSRLNLINQELKIVTETAPALNPDDADTLARLRGVVKELQAGIAETVKVLYPNVKPVEADPFPVTSDTIDSAQAFAESGSISQLNEESIPGWDSLPAEQRLIFRIKALGVFFGTLDKDAMANTFIKLDSIGFGNQRTLVDEVRGVLQVMQEKVIERHLPEWLKDAESAGFGPDNPLVIGAKEIVNHQKEK